MSNSAWKEKIEYYAISVTIFLLFFGAIYISGATYGDGWDTINITFSWDMLNVKELKKVLSLE
ncbi:hypothetical protein [Jeotgalibacillus proteolyticus]|uniref:DNA-directed RNA polymerase subunit beta n=1 Tax=Jeotgalibacillus proteolyticus TaxID=2082395 RepID=A0A2S5GDE4_9BACL|nr:hypothetical protein [Jeotgalibacillus proteolyticus]PPA70978.1 hypothetical protein C4B60_09350 [Jeotgalibacillus proteolyticus]